MMISLSIHTNDFVLKKETSTSPVKISTLYPIASAATGHGNKNMAGRKERAAINILLRSPDRAITGIN